MNAKCLTAVVLNLKPEVIVHLASKTGVSDAENNRLIFEQININGVLNIINASRKANIRHIIYASSSSVYGNYDGPVDENTVLNPIGFYGATKLAAEKLLRDFHQESDTNITVIRPFTVFGPLGRPDMAPWLFADLIIKEQTISLHNNTSRDFTSVYDVVRSFDSVIQNNLLGYNVFNIGAGQPHTTLELIHQLSKTLSLGYKIQVTNLPTYMPRVTHANISNANKLLGWKPEMDFDESVAEFAQWYTNTVKY